MRGAVVFDLDGTLIDSHRDLADAVNATLADLGRAPHPVEAVKQMIGHGVVHLLTRALGESDREQIDRARARFILHYRAGLLRTTVLYEGVPALLERLAARGIRLGLATNKPAEMTAAIVAGLAPLARHIAGVASADETTARKPDPAVLRLALARAAPDAPLDATVYVGDMSVDVEAARALGCRVLGAGWGFAPEQLAAASPDGWAADPQAAGDILTRWLG
ncbi:MAG: HAD-IA family hydrolase [Deltaproteobacteria bacterium]|nr:HAD-IA family hydrolase [Deltaproteobacteria bacterium]